MKKSKKLVKFSEEDKSFFTKKANISENTWSINPNKIKRIKSQNAKYKPISQFSAIYESYEISRCHKKQFSPPK